MRKIWNVALVTFCLVVMATFAQGANLVLDDNRLQTMETLDQVAGYLEETLESRGNAPLNDEEKESLATFLETAITAMATVQVTAADNGVVVSISTLERGLTKAQQAVTVAEVILRDHDITLLHDLAQVVRVVANGVDVSKPMDVVLTQDLVLPDQALQICLGDTTHGVQVSAQNLTELLGQHGTLTIRMERQENGTYQVKFLDRGDNLLEEIVAPVTVFLPCAHEFYTVMARYGAQVDNWGGQFSKGNSTIAFATSYAGTYELLDNSQVISDIGELREDTQKAIAFMISKGFFALDDQGKFCPDDTFSRQDATRALVSMFFTLDRNLTCDFPDVSPDSPYYSYIASATADNIIKGHVDGTFGGENPMSTEEILAICARTLVEEWSYVYPGEPANYLALVDGADTASDWAVPHVALAIRDTIHLVQDPMNPTAPVTREAAACYLYRLFLRLTDVRPVAPIHPDLGPEKLAIPEATETTKTPGIDPIIVILLSLQGVAILAGPTIQYLRGRRKKVKK